jgi:hypothetical protein
MEQKSGSGGNEGMPKFVFVSGGEQYVGTPENAVLRTYNLGGMALIFASHEHTELFENARGPEDIQGSGYQEELDFIKPSEESFWDNDLKKVQFNHIYIAPHKFQDQNGELQERAGMFVFEVAGGPYESYADYMFANGYPMELNQRAVPEKIISHYMKMAAMIAENEAKHLPDTPEDLLR